MSPRPLALKVLCRTCANCIGRTSGPERRASLRACGAGLIPEGDVFYCESYVSRPIAAAITAISHRGDLRRA